MVEISEETITLRDEMGQVRIKRNTDHNLARLFLSTRSCHLLKKA